MSQLLNNETELSRLLHERNAHPDRAPMIDQQIRQTFERDCAIFILDMSGFSRLTLRHGIIHFLAMIQRMCAIAVPIVAQHQGQIIKQEADNLFVLFPDVRSAVDMTTQLLAAFAAVNAELPADQDLYASIGIGYGKTLVVGDRDLYGFEMNLACKLGEDLARRGEVLLTEAAYQNLGAPPNWEHLTLSVPGSYAGLEISAYKLMAA